MGTKDEPRPTFISRKMSPEEREVYLNFLKKTRDVFVWTYTKIFGLDLKISMHRLYVGAEKYAVKQGPRWIHADLVSKIEAGSQ